MGDVEFSKELIALIGIIITVSIAFIGLAFKLGEMKATVTENTKHIDTLVEGMASHIKDGNEKFDRFLESLSKLVTRVGILEEKENSGG